MRVIGIDPGIGITGFSIIDHSRLETSLIAYGAIRPPKKQGLEKRLFYLFNEMNQLNDKFDPDILAIEDSFYSKNVKSAMILGQARGTILLSAARASIKVAEFAPRKVKQSVCGNGSATKEQVQFMVGQILKLKDPPNPIDISDAMAVGLCFINQNRFL
jgi:crossover junction endodeoxyribonuclease RuvC|tara:strand:- start:7145 stop:7621 length:477 start_codon:yes stop_codon:yes gene_type:complete